MILLFLRLGEIKDYDDYILIFLLIVLSYCIKDKGELEEKF